MAKPEAWRLRRASYPFSTQMDTRFQDLDTLGHINNVAMAAMFETARIRFHRNFGSHPSQQGVRWLIAAVSLNYVREAHFPDDVEIVTGLHHIGKTSWEIFSAAFQDGECVATCDTVMVAHGPEGRRHISSDMRDQMAQYFVHKD